MSGELALSIRIRADGQAEVITTLQQLAMAAGAAGRAASGAVNGQTAQSAAIGALTGAAQQGGGSLVGLAAANEEARQSAHTAATGQTAQATAITAMASSARQGITALGQLDGAAQRSQRATTDLSQVMRLLQTSTSEAAMAAQRFEGVRFTRQTEQDPYAAQRQMLRQRMAVVDEAFVAGAISAREAARESGYLADRLRQISPAALQAAAAQQQAAASTTQLTGAIQQSSQVAGQSAAATQVSAGQMAMARRTVIANLVNMAQVAVVTRGNLIATLSPLPDVMYGVSQMGVGAQESARKIMLLGGGLAAVAIGMATVAVHAATTESRTREMTSLLRAMGEVAGVTGERLRIMSEQAAMAGPFSRTETAQAAMAVAAQPGLPGATYGRVLNTAVDMAAATQQDVTAVAAMLAKTLAGGVGEIQAFDKAWNILTADEAKQIRVLAEHGKQMEVMGVAMDALDRRFKGLAREGMSEFGRAWAGIGDSWSAFMDKVAQTDTVSFLSKTFVQPPLRWMAEGPAPQESPEKMAVNRAKSDLAELEKTRKAFTDSVAADSTGWRASDLAPAISKLNQQIQAKRQELEVLNQKQQAHIQTLEKQAQEAQAQLQKSGNEAIQQLSQKSLDAALGNYRKQREVLAAAPNMRDMVQAEQEAGEMAKKEKLSGPDTETLKKAAKDFVIARNQSQAVDAVAEVRLQVAAQERLAAAVGHGAGAMAAATAQNQAAAMAARMHGVDVDKLARSYEEVNRAQLTVQFLDTAAKMTLQENAALDLAAAWKSGSMAAVEQKERQGEITLLAHTTGVSYEVAAQKVNSLRDALKQLGVAQPLAELKHQVAMAQQYTDALQNGGEVAASKAQVAIDTQNFARQHSLSPNSPEAQQFNAGQEALRQESVRRRATAFNLAHDASAAYAESLREVNELDATGILTTKAKEEGIRQITMTMLEASREWSDGAKLATMSYANDATNAARNMASAWGNTFRGLEDALVEFVTKGKVNFASLASFISAELVRIQIRSSITGPLSNMLSGLFGSPMASAKGNAFSSGQPIQAFGTGGAFTNQVVSSPTLFPLGLMGEAGDEAIMPLTRTNTGHLGVRAVGGGGSVINLTIAPVINMTGREEGKGGQAGSRMADSVTRMLKQVVLDEIRAQLRPGGALYQKSAA